MKKITPTPRTEITLTIITSGPADALNKYIEDHRKYYKFETTKVAPQIFRTREEHAISEGDEPSEETTQQTSDLLWRKYNYGIHPDSEKEGGFVGIICQKTTKFPMDIIDVVGSQSFRYPELYFDVTCDDPIDNYTNITLLVAGEIVLFSDITNKWSRPKDALNAA